jgi:hypothetical protein
VAKGKWKLICVSTLTVSRMQARAEGSVNSRLSPAKKDPVMKGYVADIEGLTEANKDFRHVVYTGQNLQLVLMSLV